MDFEFLNLLPNPSFVTDIKGNVEFQNNKMQVFVEKAETKNIIHLLMDQTDDKFIFTNADQASYLFVKSELRDYGDFYLYMGIESSSIEKLIKKLKETEQLNRELDTIIENSYDGIYITDSEGRTLKTNTSIERITGIPKEYYIGKKVDNLIKRGILENSVTHKVVKEKRTVSIVQANFKGKETLITGNPVFNKNGEVEKVVTNIRDLSELNELQLALRKANELNENYKKELEKLKGGNRNIEGIIVSSQELKMVYETAQRISNVDATVLILGETGVGKDVLAKFIFNNSLRAKDGEFIKINCGAIPPDLLESELFGYESGAFTGASKNGKPGMFELANNGVLFLDEIGELTLSLQVKLLRALQEQEIQRIGGTKTKKVNVRVIAATNRNLKEMVNEGTFREDLFYRLNVIPICIPPLRDRRDDILPLVGLFLNQVNKKYGFHKILDKKLKDFLKNYHWPGNTRELANLIERMVLTTEADFLSIDNLPFEYRETSHINEMITDSLTLKEAVEFTEEKILANAAKKYDNTYEIAKALATSQPTIVRKLKKYKITIKQ
ncbi:sigma54 specific transcriptional regulator [Halalkalibacter wakoensis JCM 9140]|uniref:HTH-type transcriptional regulatory protein TyrR n=1 Tax=Halalkalibacter wakoensis JCM 9140 TaxID=1236970 RepID=W4Q718_9BACI|nr:sigma 54-interacting transcriptional regulator [Halalkalibacter wakoensis]GAE27179.1 sigma54 specific transcriptional regulator [Halalkalibacter wakoensis JCM 9140]